MAKLTIPQIIPLRLLVGRMVAGLRDQLNLTQAELAEATGIPYGAITRLELGQRTASLEILLRLERLLFRRQWIGLPGELTEMIVSLRQLLRDAGYRAPLGKVPEDAETIDADELDPLISAFLDLWRDEMAAELEEQQQGSREAGEGP